MWYNKQKNNISHPFFDFLKSKRGGFFLTNGEKFLAVLITLIFLTLGSVSAADVSNVTDSPVITDTPVTSIQPSSSNLDTSDQSNTIGVIVKYQYTEYGNI